MILGEEIFYFVFAFLAMLEECVVDGWMVCAMSRDKAQWGGRTLGIMDQVRTWAIEATVEVESREKR